MKLKNICLASLCVVMLTGCSDSFLENVPQGSLSDGVMNSPEAIDLFGQRCLCFALWND